MKGRFLFALLAVLSLVLVASWGVAADKPSKDTKCPVSGRAINPEATADHNGGTVYFCCGNCVKKFNADAKPFATKANAQLAQTGQIVQAKCPISKQDFKKGTEEEVASVKVAFCCNNCKGKFAKMSDDEKLKTAFEDISVAWKKAEAEKK
jgi:YHS domain-containing protein